MTTLSILFGLTPFVPSFRIIKERQIENGKPKQNDEVAVKDTATDQATTKVQKHLRNEILKRLLTGEIYTIPSMQNELVSDKVFESVSDSGVRKHLRKLVEIGMARSKVGNDRYKTVSYWIDNA